HILHRLCSQRRLAIRKISQHNSANRRQLPRLLQMHQRAIHLPRLHPAILEHQNRAARIQFPRRPKRRLNQRQASAKQNSIALAVDHRLALQTNAPSAAHPHPPPPPAPPETPPPRSPSTSPPPPPTPPPPSAPYSLPHPTPSHKKPCSALTSLNPTITSARAPPPKSPPRKYFEP